jgi:hypothetical protein
VIGKPPERTDNGNLGYSGNFRGFQSEQLGSHRARIVALFTGAQAAGSRAALMLPKQR